LCEIPPEAAFLRYTIPFFTSVSSPGFSFSSPFPRTGFVEILPSFLVPISFPPSISEDWEITLQVTLISKADIEPLGISFHLREFKPLPSAREKQ